MSELKNLHPHLLQSPASMTGAEWDTKTVREASGFHKYLSSTQFIVSFTIANHMLGYTKNLSKLLQGIQIWQVIQTYVFLDY